MNLTIYKGLTLRGASVTIYDENGTALPLNEYSFQFQLLDKCFNYLAQATTEIDGATSGKLNISMTTAETAALDSTVANWALMAKNTADGWIVPVDVGKVDFKDVGAWNT